MDLIDRIKELSSKIKKQKGNIHTEEATKIAFIMPFISSLGYDVFNPLEVIPEFTADVGVKKGEKVDYAIKKDDKIIILMECKWSGANLHKEHASQLYRYFTTTEARFGILTNGIEYAFYSDIDEKNKMDSKPFFVLNILNFEDHQIDELKKFTKSAFSLEDILTNATTLKYAGAIKKILQQELVEPSELFVRFFASQVYDGRLTQSVMNQFAEIVKDARKQFVKEQINQRLKSALTSDDETPATKPTQVPEVVPDVPPIDDGIETTPEEIDAYNIVKAILRETLDVKRIDMRDTKSYCGILLDNNNRKPICRLRFNTSQKYLGVISKKKEKRIPIDSVDDIFQHADSIKAVISEYTSE